MKFFFVNTTISVSVEWRTIGVSRAGRAAALIQLRFRVYFRLRSSLSLCYGINDVGGESWLTPPFLLHHNPALPVTTSRRFQSA